MTSDVNHKISELRDLYAADKINYKSVEQMAVYEEKQNEHLPVKKRKCVGSRTLLRLHRALLFVIDLMQEVCRGKLRSFKFIGSYYRDEGVPRQFTLASCK